MQTSIEMIIEEVKRLSNLYENRVPSVLLFETLFKAEEMHKIEQQNLYTEEEIRKAYFRGNNIDYLIQVLKQLKKD
jgi:hypothetical protein